MKKILALSLCAAVCVSFTACGAEGQSDSEPSLDLASYKSAVSDIRKVIYDTSLNLANVGNYQNNYWESYEQITGHDPDTDSTIKYGFNFLQENTGETEDTIKETYDLIKEKDKEIMLIDIEGKEAESIRFAYASLYDSYLDIYHLVTYPTGPRSKFSSNLSHDIERIENSNKDLCSFLGESDNSTINSDFSGSGQMAAGQTETHIYDNAEVKNVMNGTWTKKIGEYSIIRINSSEITIESLTDWYFNYVIKNDFNWCMILYTDKGHNSGVYSNGVSVDKDVLFAKDKYGDYSLGDSSGSTTYVPTDEGTLKEFEFEE